MPFDISTAREIKLPKQKTGFDMSTAKEIDIKTLNPIYEQLDIKQHPVLGRIQDIAGQTTAFPNQAGMGLPHALLKKAGYTLPEPVSAGGHVSEFVMGAGGNLLGLGPRTFAKGSQLLGNAGMKILPKAGKFVKGLGNIAKNTVVGAGTGAMYTQDTPKGDILQPEARKLGAAFGGIGGGAISTVAEVGRPVTGFVARNLARVSRDSLNTVKRVGYAKVREAMELGDEYITKMIAPKIKARTLNAITQVGNKIGKAASGVKHSARLLLEEYGFDPQDINNLARVSGQSLGELKKMASSSFTQMYNAINSKRAKIGQQIGKLYDRAESDGVKVGIRNSINNLQSILRKEGAIDLAGNITELAKTTPNTTLKSLISTYERYKPYSKTRLSMSQFKAMLNEIEFAGDASARLGQVVDKYAVFAQKVVRSLREEATTFIDKSVLSYPQGLKELNRKYADYSTMMGLSKKLDKVLNTAGEGAESFYRKIKTPLNDVTRNRFARMFGMDIVNDVDALAAAQELDPNISKGLMEGAGRAVTKVGLRTREVFQKARRSYKNAILSDKGIKPEQGFYKAGAGVKKNNFFPLKDIATIKKLKKGK